MIIDPPDQRVLVVGGMPDVDAQRRIAGRRNQCIERHQVSGDAPVIAILADRTASADQKPELGQHDVETRLQALCQIFARGPLGGLDSGHVLVEHAMEKADMAGIHVAFERLQPVAVLGVLGEISLARRHMQPFEIGQRRRILLRSHEGPDHAAALLAWIGKLADAVLETALRRLVRSVQASARAIEFPAVIDAAQSVLLVAPEEQRRSTMGAMIAEQPDLARAVAKRNEVFAEQANAHRRAIRIGQLGGEQDRLPIAAQHAAHGRARTDSCQCPPIHVSDYTSPVPPARRDQPPGTMIGRSLVLIASGMPRNSAMSLRTSAAGTGSTGNCTFSISPRNSGSASVLSSAASSALARS